MNAHRGGHKESRIGRDFGLEELKEFSKLNHIRIDEAGTREKKPWYDTEIPKH